MWKTIIWVLIAIAALSPALMFLYQRWRASRADKKGVAMYGMVRDFEPTKFFGRPSDVLKIKLWLQETGVSGREVTLQSRVPANQKLQVGMMLPIVIDPKNPQRVYPASAD